MSLRLQRLLILLTVIYLTFIGGTVYSGQFLFLKIFLQGFVTALLLFWLGSLLVQKRPLPRTPLDFPLFAYTIWLLITSALAYEPRISLEFTWRMLIHIGGFYLLVDLMRQGKQRWVMEALAIAAGVILIITTIEIASVYLGLPIFPDLEGGAVLYEITNPVSIKVARLSLALNLSTVQANYIAVVLPVLFAWGLTQPRRDNQIGLLGVCAALGLVLILTFTRGGWLAGATGFGVFFLFRIRQQPNFKIWLQPQRLVPIALITLVLVGGVFAVFVGRGIGFSSPDRINMIEIAAEMAAESPLTGFGVSQFGRQYWERHDPAVQNQNTPTAHNLWMNTAAEIGLPGLFILSWLGWMYLRSWHEEWQVASPGRKMRLEGVLAAFCAFSVHSLVDTFTSITSVLPLLIFAAYTFAGGYTISQPAMLPSPVPFWKDMRLPAALLLVVYFVWFIGLNAAESAYLESNRALSKDDFIAALDHNEQAREGDPNLALYDLQYAHILGWWASEDPSALPEAIAAYESVLKEYSAFHLGQANLAALYAQQGDYKNALKSIDRALDIRPNDLLYGTMRAMFLEEEALAAGQDPRASSAVELYTEILDSHPDLASSFFWTVDAKYTARRDAFDAFYAEADPARQLLISLALNQNEETIRLYEIISAESTPSALAMEALAEYARQIEENPQKAIEWYQQALRKEENAARYIQLAELYLATGDLAAAEDAADQALETDEKEVWRANYILAQVKIIRDTPDDREVNRLLAKAIPPLLYFPEYISVVFLRPDSFTLLPQVPQIEPADYAERYAPHLLLAERFAADEDPQTDPRLLYHLVPLELRP